MALESLYHQKSSSPKFHSQSLAMIFQRVILHKGICSGILVKEWARLPSTKSNSYSTHLSPVSVAGRWCLIFIVLQIPKDRFIVQPLSINIHEATDHDMLTTAKFSQGMLQQTAVEKTLPARRQQRRNGNTDKPGK